MYSKFLLLWKMIVKVKGFQEHKVRVFQGD
jgi:hypothetical protein